MDVGLPKFVIKCLFWQRGQVQMLKMAVFDRREGVENRTPIGTAHTAIN
jgi:hypothetical protein